MDLNTNKWGYSFLPIIDIQCMTLGLYKNQLVCVVNNGLVSFWSLEEIENFEFGGGLKERSIEYFEDDWWYRWSLLKQIFVDIHKKCSCTFLYA